MPGRVCRPHCGRCFPPRYWQGPSFRPRLLELLREVEDEEPLLGVEFSEELQRVNVQVMGEVQLEVLQAVLRSGTAQRYRSAPAACCTGKPSQTP